MHFYMYSSRFLSANSFFMCVMEGYGSFSSLLLVKVSFGIYLR
ncbi:hypothetical protein BCD_1407 (plasmid) [Borrelia crocidurae DOU]|uniref:Uncharacterized protein n=1 Tax=Borrelia crocidurae DOU TaxID=1293575 RepID=W5SLB7_9SPIR|nr:hypothetical protein BCD_1407 [Borrelia crocidurae DOU]